MPPPPPGLNLHVTPFAECSMSPQGVWSMVRHLQAYSLLQNQPEERVRAMAIAFLAFSGTSDSKHTVSPGALHDAHLAAHGNKKPLTWRGYMRDEYIRMVTDSLTWLDRISGGATILVHAPGTRPPGTPRSAEEVKLDVFLPIVLLREDPSLAPFFARLVQQVVENVGVPVMQRWDMAK